MQEGRFIPRSAEMIAECRGWEAMPDKDPLKKIKITYKGNGHGDKAIAGGMCWKAMKESARNTLDKPAKEVQDSERNWSMQGRLERRQREASESEHDDMAGFGRVFAGENW